MTWSASRAQRLDVAARGEELEGADADVARRHARQHRAGQRRLAHHRLAGRHGRQRPGRGNAERRHRLADDVFAQHRTQRRPPVAAPRERCRPRAFELDVATDSVRAHDLAQQDGAAIAQLRHEVAELVAGIGQRDRLGTRRDAITCQDGHTLRRRQRFGIEAELGGERRVELDQAGRRDRRRRKARVKALRQAGIAVVERQADGLAEARGETRCWRFVQERQAGVVCHLLYLGAAGRRRNRLGASNYSEISRRSSPW